MPTLTPLILPRTCTHHATHNTHHTNAHLHQHQRQHQQGTFPVGSLVGNAVGRGEIMGDECDSIGTVSQQSWEVVLRDGDADQTIEVKFEAGTDNFQTVVSFQCKYHSDTVTQCRSDTVPQCRSAAVPQCRAVLLVRSRVCLYTAARGYCIDCIGQLLCGCTCAILVCFPLMYASIADSKTLTRLTRPPHYGRDAACCTLHPALCHARGRQCKLRHCTDP